jgi:hypothetical protein
MICKIDMAGGVVPSGYCVPSVSVTTDCTTDSVCTAMRGDMRCRSLDGYASLLGCGVMYLCRCELARVPTAADRDTDGGVRDAALDGAGGGDTTLDAAVGKDGSAEVGKVLDADEG